MGKIIDCISYVLGLLMDLFFRGLTLVGYPRLWACIVLFAVVTRFLFLPSRIKKEREKLLSPIVKYELLKVDPKFFEKTKDKEVTIERALHKKQVYKKYKLSAGNGCLTMLLQYPILVALFYVVKHPQEFIPSLETLSNVSGNVNSFLGVGLSAIPIDSMKAAGSIGLIVFVPLIVAASSFIKMFPTLKKAKTVSEKIKVYSLCAFFVLLIGWFSAKLPLAISLYWITNDCTYMVMDFFIRKTLPKSKTIKVIYEEHKARVEKDRIEKEENAQEHRLGVQLEKENEIVTEISEKEVVDVMKEKM